ncbi:MAG: phosphoethanolamine transferase [Woeseia sp.]
MTKFSEFRERGVPAWQLALLAAIFISVSNNGLLLKSVLDRMGALSGQGAAFIITLLLFLVGVQYLFFLVAGMGRLLKPVLIAFVLLASILGYFTQELGVVFDEEMIRNIVETFRDRNAQEAIELGSAAFLQYFFFNGLLPSVFIYVTPVRCKRLLPEALSRAACGSVVVAVLVLLALSNWKYTSFFYSENRDLRLYMTPTYAVSSLEKYIRHNRRNSSIPFREIDADAMQAKSDGRRTVGIVVVGETARSDHFSLNGYPKKTNPLLERAGVVSFRNVSACGTSTAWSVPCMFSLRDRRDFSPDIAANESNVLDLISHAGVHVVWIDDNSGCKAVCTRVEHLDIGPSSDREFPRGDGGPVYDEDMLALLDEYVFDTTSDVLIVLHTIGSHGPAYHKRFPDSFAVFRPYCETNSPQDCSDKEVANAYDNTIVYTDFVLNETIGYLRQNEEKFDSFLLYASDHGESLGENGVYLHGLPYSLAPESQINVPMIFWMSAGMSSSHHLSRALLTSKSDAGLSHDNISHSLLGLFNIKSKTYKTNLDVFRPRS